MVVDAPISWSLKSRIKSKLGTWECEMTNKNCGGRKRTTNPLGLPANVHKKHGAFYFVHSMPIVQGTQKRRWEHLGRDIEKALLQAEMVREAKS